MRRYASLRRSAAFARVRQRGRRLELGVLRVFWLRRSSGATRVGITVPGSVGGAVLRNRVRRRIQGALDGLPLSSWAALGAGDIVLIARPQAGAVPYRTIAREIGAGLTRLGEASAP